jgi:hypothetical protein
MPAEQHGRTWARPQPCPPKPGDELWIDREASVQFARQPRFMFRVISVCPKPTYPGWVWLTGYQLDERGNAVDKREIFVRLAGLRSARRSDGRLGSESAFVSRSDTRRTPPQRRS